MRWIAAQPPEQRARLEAERARNERLRGEFERLIRVTRERLVSLYAGDAPPAVKEQQKEAAFAAMRADYETVKHGEPGLAGFDRWFSGYDNRGPNNASIASIALYTERVPAVAFYAKVRALAALDRGARDAALDAVSGMPVARLVGVR